MKLFKELYFTQSRLMYVSWAKQNTNRWKGNNTYWTVMPDFKNSQQSYNPKILPITLYLGFTTPNDHPYTRVFSFHQVLTRNLHQNLLIIYVKNVYSLPLLEQSESQCLKVVDVLISPVRDSIYTKFNYHCTIACFCNITCFCFQ